MPRALPKELRDKALSLFVSGVPPKEVALQLELSINTVRRWVARGRWLATRIQTREHLRQKMATGLAISVASEESTKLRQDLAEELADQVAVLRTRKPKYDDLGGRDGRAATVRSIATAAALVHDWGSGNVTGILDFAALAQANQEPAVDVASEVVAEPQNDPEVLQPGLPDSASASQNAT